MAVSLLSLGFDAPTLRWFRIHDFKDLDDLTSLTLDELKNTTKRVSSERLSDILGSLALHDIYLRDCDSTTQRKEYIMQSF